MQIGEIDDDKRSIHSIRGVRRDSEVIYVGTFDPVGKRGKLADVFEDSIPFPSDGLTRSKSHPDFLSPELNTEVMFQEPYSILDRPGFGSIAFR